MKLLLVFVLLVLSGCCSKYEINKNENKFDKFSETIYAPPKLRNLDDE